MRYERGRAVALAEQAPQPPQSGHGLASDSLDPGLTAM
jgi:hypothetical protein